MKNVFSFLAVLFILNTAHADGAWNVFLDQEQSINGIAGSSLDTHVLFLSNKEGRRAGPVVLWYEPKSGHVLQLSNALSVADLAIKESTPKLTESQKKSAVRIILSGVYRRDQAIFLGPAVRDDYLSQMKEKVSGDEANKIAKLLPKTSERWTENAWEISIASVTQEGAIELYTFSGTLDPVTVKKQTVEVIAETGTAKAFPYYPQLSGK